MEQAMAEMVRPEWVGVGIGLTYSEVALVGTLLYGLQSTNGMR